MTGRPPYPYTDELADTICEAVSTSSKGLHLLCKERSDFPCITVVKDWLLSNKYPYFTAKYAHAREQQQDFFAEEILAIADDGSKDLITIQTKNGDIQIEDKEVTNRSKLRVDTRKWLMMKLAPKKYGDKQEIDITTQGDKITQPIITAIVDGKIIDGGLK